MSRKREAWCPERGAISNTFGSCRGTSRSKRIRLQKGVERHATSRTATERPSICVVARPKGGLGYRRVARSSSSLAEATARPSEVPDIGNAGWDQRVLRTVAQEFKGAAM